MLAEPDAGETDEGQTGEVPLLRFVTCGSVDDGKSTLIGRLLYDAKAVQDDQVAALQADSRRFGTQEEGIDLALLVDGLSAEREQGITIDVAYRYFATGRRRFIVADTPGHEQYTRNMVTGASTSDLAVILVDARRGVLTQTRRHSCITHLLGVRSIVLAVNKMDLVGHDQARFEAIVAEYRAFAETIGIEAFTPIPMSAIRGDNVTARSERMAWHDGPTLLGHLELVQPAAADREKPFRMPVQLVVRPDLDFRGFAGLICAGAVRPGDAVRVAPGGRTTTVSRIVTMDGDLATAEAGRSVVLCLADEVDCSRGDVIAAAGAAPAVADQFEAAIVWTAEEPMAPGRPYWMKLATQTVTARVASPKHRIGMDTLERLAAKTLEMNDVGAAVVSTDRAMVFEAYEDDRNLGGFILIDKMTNATVAAGMIRFALRRAQNVHWQAIDVTREAHARLKGHAPCVLWFTGLSGAGKSTIANLVEKRLHAMGRHTFLLDGDNVRHGLNKDLGFTDADRVENIRRVGEVARLMTDAGLIVITAFISPFAAERQMVRAMMEPREFIEVHVDAPLQEAEARDVKGLYRKARAGLIKNFTGIDSPYEPPSDPEVRIDTIHTSPEVAAEIVVAYLLRGAIVR